MTRFLECPCIDTVTEYGEYQLESFLIYNQLRAFINVVLIEYPSLTRILKQSATSVTTTCIDII